MDGSTHAVAVAAYEWGLAAMHLTLKRPAQLGSHGGLSSKPTCPPPCVSSSYGYLGLFKKSHFIRVRSSGEAGNWSARLDTQYEPLNGTDFAEAIEERRIKEGLQLPEEGYIGLFVRMLGMDNPIEDREEAVRALWRHSMGGMECINEIVAFPGILALLVSLLPSTRPASSEAAAGLLRNISSSNVHRRLVAESGAVEEIIGILTRRTLSQEVREQAANCLWILSLEEVVRNRVNISELLLVLLAMLNSEGSDKEAASGILANFSLNESNHELLVEAGLIPRLANLLKSRDGTKVTRQEVRKVFLKLVQNAQYKQMIIEEGLVPVPLIGANAYQSFKPLLDVAPTLPENLKVEPSPSLPSTFGAGELLLGLKGKSNAFDLDDATQLAIEGRARQHFLGRIGLLEKEARKQEAVDSSTKDTVTIMSWWDGIPRLILILGLEDISVATLAASTISEIAINEEIRQAVYKAGSIPHLVRLLGSGDESATEAAASAVERLAVSLEVRRSIYAHGTTAALVEILKAVDAPGSVKEKVLTALDRLSQTGEEVQAMIRSGAFPGLVNIAQSKSADAYAKQEAEGILEELSSRKADSRDKIVDVGGVPALVKIIASESPLLKEKATRVMENLAVTEQHAGLIVSAGVELPLKSLLEGISAKGDLSESLDIVEKEETWAAIAAAARLLSKLLMHEKTRAAIDCRGFALILAQVLKSEAPMHVKDWISACLLNLDRLVGIMTNVCIPIELDIIVHDTIPRLVDEIGNSINPDGQERAANQLHELVSQGVEDYAAAILNAGGIFPLVKLLENGTPKAREEALSVLYNLGTNEENHPVLIRAGVVTSLQRIVRCEFPQWTLALHLLRALPT